MKLNNYIIFALILLFKSISGKAQEAKVTHHFTLQECIDYALEHNEEVEITRLESQKQQNFVNEVRAQGLPQITASIDLANNFEVPTTFIPAIIFDPNADQNDFVGVKFQTQYNGAAMASFTQLIFDGSYFLGLQAARTFTQISAKDHFKRKIDLVEAVAKSYYTVLVNKERLELIRTNYYRLDTLLRETELLYQNGFAEKIDVNRVKVQFNNIKTEKENTERLLLLSYSLLKYQISMPIEEDLVPVDNLADVEFNYDPDLEKSFTYEKRVEYSQMQVREELAHLDLKNIKFQYIPKLELYANVGYTAGTNSMSQLFEFGRDDSWFGFGVYGLRMSIPIFDGLLKSSQVQQRRIRIRQVENQFERLEKSIDLEIQQAKIEMKNNIERMNVQMENMELAKEVFDITNQKYQQGLGSNLEVIEADADYKEAQTNYYNALFDALISKVEYQKSLGSLTVN